MALYEYRCDRHGSFDVFHPLGSAPASMTCAVCGDDAARVFTPPMLSNQRPDIINAIDNAKKSAHEPEVVTSLPTSGRKRVQPMAPPTPKLMSLPRH